MLSGVLMGVAGVAIFAPRLIGARGRCCVDDDGFVDSLPDGRRAGGDGRR